MHILVVEDDRALAGLLRKGLSEERHVVDVCHDGLDGLARAESDTYDGIVLDVMLPGLSGLEITRRLHAESRAFRAGNRCDADSSRTVRAGGVEVRAHAGV
jgi:two-component system OmpR family response regulator